MTKVDQHHSGPMDDPGRNPDPGASGAFPPMRRLLIISTACAALMAPATALAASGDDVIKDCLDNGKIDRHYTQDDYRQAERNMPADVDEYTDCRDQIHHARLAAARDTRNRASGGGVATGGGGGPTAPTVDQQPATKAEGAAADRATRHGSAPVRVAGASIRPGAPGTLASSTSSIPGPLLAVLILLGAGALGAILLAVRTRVAGGRRI